MPKTIDTLVEDIYALFGNGERFDPELFDKFGGNLRDLMDYRFHSERVAGTLRMSNIGKPDRQLWLEVNEPEKGEPLPPETNIKFAYGDVIEQMVLLFAKMAGHDVQFEQAEVEVDGIKGHIDVVIDGVLVDVKSASTFSFKKFETRSLLEPGNDPFGYIAQLSGYVEAKTPGGDGCFLAIDKQLGKLCLCKITAEELKQYDVRKRIAYVKEMVNGPMPDRCYDDVPDGKSGNRKLSLGCSYCSRKFQCWPNLKVYGYATGPKFLTQVVREPRVDEFPVT